jgi:hypothetical protein
VVGPYKLLPLSQAALAHRCFLACLSRCRLLALLVTPPSPVLLRSATNDCTLVAFARVQIFSYVISGELEHKDSMGNTEIIRKGEVQMTSAGTGISRTSCRPQLSC